MDHLDDVNTLNLKITPMIMPPPVVYGHQVPIFVCTADDMEATKVDLALQQVPMELDSVCKQIKFLFKPYRLCLTSMGSIIF